MWKTPENFEESQSVNFDIVYLTGLTKYRNEFLEYILDKKMFFPRTPMKNVENSRKIYENQNFTSESFNIVCLIGQAIDRNRIQITSCRIISKNAYIYSIVIVQ